MMSVLSENSFPVSLHSTPSPLHQEVFYTVPRAGHLIAGRSHHIQRKHFPGHELILCLRGRGWTRIEGQLHKVASGTPKEPMQTLAIHLPTAEGDLRLVVEFTRPGQSLAPNLPPLAEWR